MELYVSYENYTSSYSPFTNKREYQCDRSHVKFSKVISPVTSLPNQNLRIMIRRTVHDSKIAMRLETRLVKVKSTRKSGEPKSQMLPCHTLTIRTSVGTRFALKILDLD